jgi:Fe-S-cluster containining protein
VPDLDQPAIFPEDDHRLDQLVDAVDMPPCPCLGDAGECLIYESRPLACRLEGVPMVDIHEGVFGDWCELNFRQGIPDGALGDLQQDYNRIDELQEARSAAIARRAALSDHRAVTLIPSVIAEYENFWKRLI